MKKIAIYAISLNEEKFIQRFVESCREADLIVLADTGSKDNTVKIARELGITVYDITVSPWRFDTARNIALGLIPSDIDICISLDVDEVMVPGWRAIVEDAMRPGVTRLQYRFDNGMGNIFNATKIHARKGYQWHNLCHEMIKPDPRIKETWATINDILIEHHPDPTKSRGQYLPMLKAGVEENPYDHRDRWYLAREYFYNNEWQASIDTFDHYLNMPSATWHHERGFAFRVQGRCYMNLGQHNQALRSFRLAVDEARYVRDTWCDLAQACFELQQWQECFYAATQGLTITEREYVFTSGPEPWGYKLYDLAALAAYHLKMKEVAIHYGGLALEHDLTNPRLIKNCEYYLAL